jgi:hypothetical protein
VAPDAQTGLASRRTPSLWRPTNWNRSLPEAPTSSPSRIWGYGLPLRAAIGQTLLGDVACVARTPVWSHPRRRKPQPHLPTCLRLGLSTCLALSRYSRPRQLSRIDLRACFVPISSSDSNPDHPLSSSALCCFFFLVLFCFRLLPRTSDAEALPIPYTDTKALSLSMICKVQRPSMHPRGLREPSSTRSHPACCGWQPAALNFDGPPGPWRTFGTLTMGRV